MIHINVFEKVAFVVFEVWITKNQSFCHTLLHLTCGSWMQNQISIVKHFNMDHFYKTLIDSFLVQKIIWSIFTKNDPCWFHFFTSFTLFWTHWKVSEFLMRPTRLGAIFLDKLFITTFMFCLFLFQYPLLSRQGFSESSFPSCFLFHNSPLLFTGQIPFSATKPTSRLL